MKPARLLLYIALVAVGTLAGFGYGRWYGQPESALPATEVKQSRGFYCPMHPHYRSDKPGDCPICGMKLVPDDTGAVAQADSESVSPAMPVGTVHIDPRKQQLIGVKIGEATSATGVHTFRAVGTVAMDETRVAKVQTRIDGWIEQVYVDFTGKLVEKGQPLLALYSPEMLATQQEYLLAIRSREVMRASPLAGTRQQSESLIGAARKRLELWDLSDAQIDQIAKTGEPMKNITLYSPISGYVMMRNAFPKQRITPETELYTVADLSKVWIMAGVFENEASMIRIGMPVSVSMPYAGGRSIQGRVNYIQPEVDMTTRSLKVRIEADNPGMILKPEMFVDVDFRVGTASRVTVPSEAVLDTGVKQTVFVAKGNGYFEPRQVETGERVGGRVEVIRGLAAGEQVVVSGNFLIDSESQLKAAAAGMTGRQHESPASAPAAPGEHRHD
jgi:RND family efflux transporter MFP subunit